ncbi:MAG: hypothetical protein HY537_17675 [Deltaproteobacteria bacterium]|nr:hypothetical protein [Deltaproteobacteria bacterium]
MQCDLEFPPIVEELGQLEAAELEAVLNKVETINKMTWAQVYSTSSKGPNKRGLNWEVLPEQTTASGNAIASIRITKKFRARVTRDGVFMRFISLHPDHDSAYKASGEEDI